MALYLLLNRLGHETFVISPTKYPSFLDWMPSSKDIIIYSESINESIKITNEADLLFLLDFNQISRIGDYSRVVASSNIENVVMIDHHQSPDIDLANIVFSDTLVSSTSELLFNIIVNLGYENLINKEIGECIYTGIMTDTGSFKFATNADTHIVASKLIDRKIDNSRIHNLIYNTFSEDRMRLLGYAISKKLHIFSIYRSSLISLSEQDLKDHNFKQGDTEGLVNYGLSLDNIVFSALIIEQDGLIKISLRSIGDVKVNEIAKKYFNGGGHMNAAGGISHKSLNDTIKDFTSIFKDYKKNLLTK